MAPDPTLTSTSADGGVLFGNLPSGRYTITASKAPFTDSPLTFLGRPPKILARRWDSG